jgi:hypothetical protein
VLTWQGFDSGIGTKVAGLILLEVTWQRSGPAEKESCKKAVSLRTDFIGKTESLIRGGALAFISIAAASGRACTSKGAMLILRTGPGRKTYFQEGGNIPWDAISASLLM